MLSAGRPRELLNAIAAGDAARFQAVPGIGKRTAERVIVELREKVAGRVSEEIVVRRGASDDPRTAGARRAGGPGLLAPGGGRHARGGIRSHSRGPDLRGAQGIPVSGIKTPGVERVQDPAPLAAEDELDRSLRPRRLEDFVGPGAREGAAGRVHRGGEGPRRGTRPRVARGAARAREDVARPDRGGRARRRVRGHGRAGARAQGRRGQLSHRARSAQRVLRGRDPPAPARAGGDLLSGDGGPQAPDHRRSGRGGARGHDRSARSSR